MKKNKLYLFILPVVFMAIACTNAGLKRTKSGLLYKIISDGKGELPKRGQFLKLNFVQKVGDSVLYNSANAVPAYVRIDSIGPNYSAAEIFPMLRKGDSAVVIQLADSIQRKFGQQLPPPIKKRDKIFLMFKVLDVFTTQDLVIKDRDNEMQKEKQKEIKIVEDYLAGHKINFQKTTAGTYVEVKSVGDGPAVDSGKMVSVLYTGKMLPSGKVFESNINTPGSNGPIKFVVGRHSIIQGWDDGLRLFKKGGRGTLYIPAFLAYDAQPGPDNKPYANLMFDVEVVDVTEPPAQPARPTLPQMKIEPRKDSSHAQPKKTK